MQDEQFKTEIKNLEAMQQSAYDQIRFHRLVTREEGGGGGECMRNESRLHVT